MPQDVVVKRRPGRKPGSTNKPKTAAAVEKAPKWQAPKPSDPLAELRNAFALVKEFQREFVLNSSSGTDALTEIRDELSSIRNMVMRLCEHRGIDAPSFRSATGD